MTDLLQARANHELTTLSGLRMQQQVPIILGVSFQRIADLVTTAIESPIGEWFKKAAVVPVKCALDFSMPAYSQGSYWIEHEAGLRCKVENPVNDGNGATIIKTLTMIDFQRALALMATKDNGAYARFFADFLGENDDAITADLFMQLAIYGEEVFA